MDDAVVAAYVELAKVVLDVTEGSRNSGGQKLEIRTGLGNLLRRVSFRNSDLLACHKM